jgi:hypothetical protein
VAAVGGRMRCWCCQTSTCSDVSDCCSLGSVLLASMHVACCGCTGLSACQVTLPCWDCRCDAGLRCFLLTWCGGVLYQMSNQRAIMDKHAM